MSFGTRLNAAFTTGRTLTSLVPTIYDVAIAGRPYMLDTSMPGGTHQHASIPYLTKFLTSPVFGSPTSVNEVGETSLNPDVNWRRSTANWNAGAGQLHFDLRDSDRSRFHQSKGIDPWTRGQFSLLPDTTSQRTTTNTNLHLETAGTYLYLSDGASLVNSTDGVTWSSAITGLSGTIASFTTDGYSLWVGVAGGTYLTTRGSASAAKTNDLVPDVLAYRKGRLMASKGPSIYNITSGYLSGPPTGLTVTGVATVQRSHTYSLGALVIPATPNGHYYKCTTAGTTGTAIPTWPTTSGGTVTDGTVVWTEQGATATNTYRVTAHNTAGETLACSEVGAIGAASLSASVPMSLSWAAVVGASSYTVYGRTAGAELQLAVVASGTAFTDDGSKTPNGALPAADTTGAAPAALFTHPNSDWQWVGFASGDSCIYAAGVSGDQSAIYRLPIKPDGTGLDAAVQAGELPKGETALCIVAYLGFVFIGTTSGVRWAQQASSGELQIGSVIPAGPVRCASGDGQWVWFGWENYDTTCTGLGRMDLTVINTDAPAYATDLQAAGKQGQVGSVVTFNSKRVFTIQGVGVWMESANLVASGFVDSGLITFDLPDPKVAQAVDVRHSSPLVGSHSVALAPDQGAFVNLGTHSPSTAETAFVCQDIRGDVFELRQTLTRSTTDATKGPSVSRFTLMALPAALSGEQLQVPVLLRAREQPARGGPRMRDVGDELTFLKSLRTSKQSFMYQEAGLNLRGVMQDYVFYPLQMVPNRSAFEGTFVATILVQSVIVN